MSEEIRAKDIVPHKTSFSAGDGFYGDGDTSFFMEAGKLLELTAENALAGNVAEEFVPNSTTTVAGYLYIYNGSLFVAKEVYQGAWDASKFTHISVFDYINSFANFVKQVISVSDYNLNNCPVNSLMYCADATCSASVINKPTTGSNAFLVYTLSQQSGVDVQIFVDEGTKNNIYIRARIGAWGAWQIVSKSLMKEFSASSVYWKGQFVFKDNTPYQAKQTVGAGDFDPSKWDNVTDKLTFLTQQVISVSDYNLNNCPVNSLMYCANATYSASVINKPTTGSNRFLVYTISQQSEVVLQIFVDEGTKNDIYIRSCIGAWSAWNDVVNKSIMQAFSTSGWYWKGKFAVKDNVPYQALQDIGAGDFDPSKWDNVTDKLTFLTQQVISITDYNLNNCPVNSLMYCADATCSASVINKPTTGSNAFLVYTLSQQSGVDLQIFVDSGSNNDIYIRARIGVWGNWKNVSYVPEIEPANILSSFDNAVCIGDSLTWSAVYTDDDSSHVRQAHHTYPELLASRCNFTQETLATGGYTTKQSWENYNNSLVAKTNAVCIIYLGTNGGLTDTLATDAPENQPYSNWADTNTGCYAKWVAKAQELGYKVLLIKPYGSTGVDPATTRAVIDQVAERFKVSVVGPVRSNDYKYHYWPNLQGINTSHYNDLGYAWFTDNLIAAVAKLPSDNMKYLIPS